MLKQKKQILWLVVGSVLWAIPALTHARGLVPCGGDGEHPCSVNDLFGFAARIISILISMSGFVAIAYIIRSGFGMVLSQGNTEAVGKHKQGLTNAVLGFVLVLLSFLIVTTVANTVFRLDPPLNLSKPQCYLNPNSAGCR